MLDEQTRKMKLAKSVKWQFIRMKKMQMLQEQQKVIEMNERANILVRLMLKSLIVR